MNSSTFLHCVASYSPEQDVTYVWYHSDILVEFERVYRLGENKFQIWYNPHYKRVRHYLYNIRGYIIWDDTITPGPLHIRGYIIWDYTITPGPLHIRGYIIWDYTITPGPLHSNSRHIVWDRIKRVGYAIILHYVHNISDII